MWVVSLIIAFVICGFAVLFGVLIVYASFLDRSWRRWPTLAGGLLIPIGVAAFIGQGISAIGGFNWLPESFEWPAGWVDNVITTDNGLRVVPTNAAGRVQVYDADWNFIRGWHIGRGATGAFALRPLHDDRFEVFTARGNHHYVFNTEGKLLSEATYPGAEYGNVTGAGESLVVPTAWWLWPFSEPLIAWLVGIAGMALVGLASWKRRTEAERQTVTP